MLNRFMGSYRRVWLVMGAIAAAAVLALSSAASAAADNYPSNTIRLVVPYAPGGSTDVMTRLLAPKIAEFLKGTAVVENVAGAQGAIGANQVTDADPDGHTLAVLPAVLAITMPVMDPSVHYANLVPVALIQSNHQVLLARPDFPGDTLADVIEKAKASPGAVSYGHTGVGTGNHLLAKMIETSEGLEFNLVAYAGETPALNDAMGGHVDLVVSSIAAAGSLIEAGSLKAIAGLGTTAPERFPDMALVAERYEGFNGNSFLGLHAPQGTPQEILDKLAEAVDFALKDKEISDRIRSLGGEPGGGGQSAYADFLAEQRERVEGVIKAANIKLEN